MVDTEAKIMSVDEYAAHQHVSAKTIYKLINNGDLPAYKVGRSWRLNVAKADKALEEPGEERTTTIQTKKQHRKATKGFNFLQALADFQKERTEKLCAIS